MQDVEEARPPLDALAALLRGNQRFAGGIPQRPNQSVTRRQMLSDGQQPFAVVLGCSDSRVPVEMLFDQGFGDLFVARNAGHVLGHSMQASIEFAVVELGVQVVFVLGHESCGAVGATVKFMQDGTALPGQLPVLVHEVSRHLDPSSPTEHPVRNHVLGTLQDLRSRSALVREAEGAGDVVVAGGVYGLSDGLVHLVSGPEAGPS